MFHISKKLQGLLLCKSAPIGGTQVDVLFSEDQSHIQSSDHGYHPSIPVSGETL